MKTTILRRLRLFLNLAFLVFAATTLAAQSATAEMSDRELETSIRERKRDFDRYLHQRKAASEKEAQSSASLREARRASELRQLELERNHRATMKRYSMQEIELRDREDEARLAKEMSAKEVMRQGFVVNRDRRRALEASIVPVNPYEEFDIDMKIEPEAKVSHPGAMDANQ